MHKNKIFLAALVLMFVSLVSVVLTFDQGPLYTADISSPNLQNTTPIWPIVGTTVVNIHDTFGPRYKSTNAALSSTAVFHHGIDIKVPVGTQVLSILDGKVTRVVESGCATHCQYRVEIKYTGANSQVFYGSYQHLSKVNVKEGDTLLKGALVGWSGWNDIASYTHLHFEIRALSDYEKNSIHPLFVLPYQSITVPTVSITSVSPANSTVIAQTVVPASQQDITGVEVFVYDNKGDTDSANDVLVPQSKPTKYDFAAYSQDPSLYGTIKVDPTDFNSSSTEQKVQYTFTGLNFPANGHTTIVFRAYTVKGQKSDTQWLSN